MLTGETALSTIHCWKVDQFAPQCKQRDFNGDSFHFMNGFRPLNRVKSTQMSAKKKNRHPWDAHKRVFHFRESLGGGKPTALSAVSQAAAGDCGRVQRKPEFLLATVRILQFPLAPALCRQLMFISSAHLGLVTKHLVKRSVFLRAMTV